MTRYNKTLSICLILMLLIMLFSGCGTGISPAKGVTINEVVCANNSSLLAESLGAPDWIELYNGTDNEVDLSGYTILRTDSTDKQYTFPEGTTVAAGGYFVVCATELVPESGAYLATGFNLPKKGTGLKLKDKNGISIDHVNIPELKDDISYCRTEDGFVYCQTPTPGSENAGVFAATLEEVEEAKAPEGLRINEVSEEFVEIYHYGTEPIDLAAFFLSDNIAKTAKWRLPYMTLNPGEYLVVSLIGEGDTAASFRLSPDETELFLFYADTVYDRMDITGLWEGTSKGLNPNGEALYYVMPTPGEKNSAEGLTSLEMKEMAEDAPLMITEFMAENAFCLVDEDGDRPGWVELYNASSEAVSLAEYYLSDNPDNLLKWQLPDEQLGAGEYLVIYLSGKDKAHHTNFGVAKGEPIILTHYTAFCKQTVNVPDESRLDNISYGLQDGKWLFFGQGTPGAKNTAHGSETIHNAEKVDRMGLWISEVSAAAAPRTNIKDWIELYNGGESAVNLNGWYLSDDLDLPQKYALKGTIAAKGYLVITAGGDEDSKDIANFGISPAGEELLLTNAQGAVVDVMATGALRAGVTSGRLTGDFSGDRVFFASPTKGTANSAAISAQLPKPEFSVTGGFYPEGKVTVELSAAEGDIYYTLNGSEPTLESTLYTGPIELKESAAISAIAVKSGNLPSDTAVQTFILEEMPKIPVVCMTIDAADYRAVRSVTEWHADKSKNIERKCNIEYYETDGKLGVSFACGTRVAGNGTRIYPQKSLALYTRPGYGQSSVVYPFFEGSPITEFQSLVLRNSGQNRTRSRMSDTLASMTFQGMNLDTAQSKFVVVYINGEYDGIYDLKEKINEHYFASYYGINADDVNLIRRNKRALAGSNTQVLQTYAKAQSLRTSTDAGYEEFIKYVDEYAWIDYIIARSYTGDFDIFNQKLWNTNDYQVRWRPIFFDCDFAFTGTNNNTLGIYFKAEGQPSPDGSITNMHIGTALKKNAKWREMFVKRYAEVLEWLPERSLEVFDGLYAQLQPEMSRHIKRWKTHSSYSEWDSAAKTQRKILEKRPYVVVKQIQNVFGLSSSEMKELFPKYYGKAVPN